MIKSLRRLQFAALGIGCLMCAPTGETEPATDQHDENQTVVTLTAQQVSAANVRIVAVERRGRGGVIDATAEIVPAANRTAQLGSRVPGRVTELAVTVGDRVSAGQVVAIIDSPELGQAKAAYLSARATSLVARQVADREAELYRERITSQRDWQRAEAEAVGAEAEREAAENGLHALGMTDEELIALDEERHFSSLMNIRSPIGGVVFRLPVVLGQMIDPSDEILSVLDGREVWTLIDVYDEHLSMVFPGQRVSVRTRAYPDSVFAGQVDNVGAVVEPSTRSVRVRVVLPNRSLALKPGMFANVSIQLNGTSQDSVLMVPESAVHRDDGAFIVFVPQSSTTFERRVVEVIETLGAWIVVADGLALGDSVVTSGSFTLKSVVGVTEAGEHGH